MPPRLVAEDLLDEDDADDFDVVVEAPAPFALRAMRILWPAFMMAGVLEALLFVVVDPTQLHWFGAEAIEWSRMTIYSVTFFILWAVIATAGAITLLLESPSH